MKAKWQAGDLEDRAQFIVHACVGLAILFIPLISLVGGLVYIFTH